jgi:hypothetical protein
MMLPLAMSLLSGRSLKKDQFVRSLKNYFGDAAS